MVLLLDADDTLWENIAVFHRVNAQYMDWVAPHIDPVELLPRLESLQSELIGVHGYGRHTFQKSLIAGVEHFAERTPSDDDHRVVKEMVAPFAWETIDLIEGVEATLATLGTRHELIMVTKGDHDEQTHKIERSGLKHHFRNTVILPEKHPEAYLQVVSDERLDPAETWMIGNSPKSDIRPALEAGLGAVLVPHEETWMHEHHDLDEHPRLLEVSMFSDLLDHF